MTTTPTPPTDPAATGTPEGAPTTTPTDGEHPPATEDAPDCSDWSPRSSQDDHPFEGCGCKACDSKAVELRSQTEGTKARAAYDAEHASGPNPDSYDAARLAYVKARYLVGPQLHDLDEKLSDAMHEIKCRIDNGPKIHCLGKAWEQVVIRLKDCRTGGCCVEEYTFEPELEGCDVAHLHAQIAKYDYVAGEAERCFTRLAAEPDCLVKRAAGLTAEVDAIVAALDPAPAGATATPTAATTATPAAAPAAAGGAPAGDTTTTPAAPSTPPSTTGAAPADAAPTDLVTLYARGLVAGWHLKQAWWGFHTIDDYVECLCRAMTVSMEGRNALAALVGELAVRTARWQDRNKCCQRLNANAVEEVIEEYLKCRGEHPDDCRCGQHPHRNKPPHEHPDDCDCGEHPHRDKPHHEKRQEPEPDDDDDDGDGDGDGDSADDEPTERSRY